MEIQHNSAYFARSNQTYIAYDPTDPLDRQHAEHIFRANPKAIPLQIHHIGHPAIFAFSGTSVVQAVFTALREGSPDRAYVTLRKGKKDKIPYLKGLLAALIKKKHHVWAGRILEIIKDRGIEIAPCLYDMISEARLIGEYQLVVVLSEKLLSISPDHIEGYHRLAEAKRLLGKPEEAALALTDAVALFPHEAHLHGHCGIAFQESGQGGQWRSAPREDHDGYAPPWGNRHYTVFDAQPIICGCMPSSNKLPEIPVKDLAADKAHYSDALQMRLAEALAAEIRRTMRADSPVN